MGKRTQPTIETPRRRVRKERSERVIQFAAPPAKGQQSFVFDDEPKHKEARDE